MAITRHLLPEGHSWLIDVMQQMGFTADVEGVCLGIGIMGAQAIQVGELEKFKDRLDFVLELSQSKKFIEAKIKILNEIKTNNPIIEWEIMDPELIDYNDQLKREALWENIRDAFRQFRNRAEINEVLYKEYISPYFSKLKKEDELFAKINDLNTFLNSVDIISNPEIYKTFLPIGAKQSDNIFDKKLLSTKMEELGGFMPNKAFCRTFSIHSLSLALNKLTEILEQAKNDYPITLVMNSFKHNITVTYCPSIHKWLMIDANDLSNTDISSNRDESIVKGLTDNDYAICAIIPTYAACYSNLLQEKINVWVNEALKIGSNNPKLKDSDGYNIFLLACMIGDKDEIERLIKENLITEMNIDYNKNIDQMTGLAIAAYAGHHDIVQLLLDNNGDPNIPDAHGDTALSLAIQANHPECVKRLLECPFTKINEINDDMKSPLTLAIEANNIEIVQLLLNAKKDILIDNKTLKLAKDNLKIATMLNEKLEAIQKSQSTKRFKK